MALPPEGFAGRERGAEPPRASAAPGSVSRGSALRGALWLGWGLLALALVARAPSASAQCDARELASYAGRTTVVSCRGGESGAQLRGPARLLFGQRMDLASARAEWLEVIPGIGPARAHAIDRARATRRFASLGELERVPGIGPATRLQATQWLEVRDAAQREDGL